MEAFFRVVYWLLAFGLAWQAMMAHGRNRQWSWVARWLLGVGSGYGFASLIGWLLAPPAAWGGYLLATFGLLVVLVLWSWAWADGAEALALDNAPDRSWRHGTKRLEGRTLDTIRFSYRNGKGEYSERSVVVHMLDAEYFEGYCLKRKTVRTFRLDRILGEVISEQTGEMLEADEWAASLRLAAGRAPTALAAHDEEVEQKEVLFTGFAKAEREALEQQAAAAGWLVRKTVTQNLRFLCAGPRAGASKLEQARRQGVRIVSREGIEALFADQTGLAMASPVSK